MTSVGVEDGGRALGRSLPVDEAVRRAHEGVDGHARQAFVYLLQSGRRHMRRSQGQLQRGGSGHPFGPGEMQPLGAELEHGVVRGQLEVGRRVFERQR